MHKTMYVPNGVVSPTALARKLGVSRQRADQILHREKLNARKSVQQALESGRVIKPTACEECHVSDVRLEAHHDDYTERFKVRWVCSTCHSLIHPHPPRSTKKRICSSCGNDVSGKHLLCEECRSQKGLQNRQCSQCGATFLVQRSQIRPELGMPALYCSRPCYWQSHNVTLVCTQCNAEFKRRKSDVSKKPSRLPFCGYACYRHWNYTRWKREQNGS